MAKAKTKTAGGNLAVPQSDAEAEQMIARLGALQRDIAEAQARHDATIAALEEPHARALKENGEAQTALVEGLAIWASANRERLTKGGVFKTVQLPTGTLLWREGRHAVKHRGLTVAEVIAAVRERLETLGEMIGKARAEKRPEVARALEADRRVILGFLRTQVALSKEAMLAAREIAETIPGVSIPRGPEEFGVEPLASQIREVA